MRTTHLRRQEGFSLIDMLAAILVIGIVSAMALPATDSSLAAHRFRGDGQSISNVLALAKMRAAARFSRARLFAHRANNSYVMQTFDKTAGSWVNDGGVMQLSRGVTFGFGPIATPPPNTQEEIGLSSECRDDDDASVANTACIVFNSRGVPIDNAGAPTGGNALYLTDGVGVYAITVTATPLIRMWWTANLGATPNWMEQQ
jgi:type II secretory pathway pseudopilin PulG